VGTVNRSDEGWSIRLGPGRTRVVAEDVAALRGVLTDPWANRPARRVSVVVSRWRPPMDGWSGRLGPLPGLLRHELSLPLLGAGRAVVTVSLIDAVPLGLIVTAALAALAPTSPLPTPASPDVTSQPTLPRWLAGSRARAADGALPPDDEIRGHDLVLQPEPARRPGAGPVPSPAGPDEPVPGLAAAVLPASAHTVRVAGGLPVVLFDTAEVNPIGREGPYGPTAPVARLVISGGPAGPATVAAVHSGPRWTLVDATGEVVCAAPLGGPFPRDLASRLARLGAVTGVHLPGIDPVAEAALLARVAATGVVVEVATLAPAVADLLDKELTEIVTAAPLGPTSEPIDWEVRSVAQRRAALRGHGAAFALARASGATFPTLGRPPSVSVLLTTRRPDLVGRALDFLDAQTYPDVEVILCLHGVDLPDPVRADVARRRRPVLVHTVEASLSFGEVIGVASGLARGSLVTKVDDDDVYGPEHVWDLVLAREFSRATMVGKPSEFVYLEQIGMTVRRRAVPSERYAAWVAGGTMLIGRGDLEAVGGWRPVPRSIDRGLLDRVIHAGGLIYRTHPLGYVYERRGVGHTWDAGLDYFLRPSGAQWRGRPPYADFGPAD
jgi:hypothetical protein